VWILIVIFTGSRDEEQSYREALICASGLAAISMIFAWFLPDQIALLRYPIQVIALFFLVDRVCESSRATTWRITIWHVVISLFFLDRQECDFRYPTSTSRISSPMKNIILTHPCSPLLSNGSQHRFADA
jgi:hypothetical protein